MSNQLQDTINYISPFCRYQSPTVGTSNMPIIGIGNIVKNVILAAPFTWRFNRNNVAVSGGLVQGQQDYNQTLSDFGFLEVASLTDSTGIIWQLTDVFNTTALSLSSVQARPSGVAVQTDNGSGGFTFRFSAVPDGAYPCNLVYQKLPVNFVNLTDLWSPIPDSFSDVYNNLSLGYYMDSCQDPRAKEYIARGIAGLLARAQGLTAMDKALFAQAYMNFDLQTMLNQLKTQQGAQAQGAR
jgi:hypothetical protein